VEQETALGSLRVPGLGLGTTDQVVPSQDSKRVSAVDPALSWLPAAIQRVELEQDTLSREPPLLGLGLGVRDQATPFHDSTRVWIVGPLCEKPAATQLVELEQDTP
jgi:hypothetical protein